jgi:hypothetical protein
LTSDSNLPSRDFAEQLKRDTLGPGFWGEEGLGAGILHP